MMGPTFLIGVKTDYEKDRTTIRIFTYWLDYFSSITLTYSR